MSYDVVIIGAGVQGLSCAYHLAKHGNLRVCVVEAAARYGTGSSGRSGSMLMKSRENSLKIQLSLYSYAWLQSFSDTFSESLIFRRTGFLSVATESLAERYIAEHNLRLKHGVPSELLTRERVSAMVPGLNVDDIVLGVYCGDDGEIDVNQIMRCYADFARSKNVDFLFGEKVLDVQVTGNSVTAIVTDSRRLQCSYVINAAGAEAANVASMVGQDLPILCRRRSLYFGKVEDERFLSGPMVEDAEKEWYYRPLGEGRLLMGMGLEPDSGVSNLPNMDFLPEVLSVAKHRAPGIAKATIDSGSSGIRPLTPDLLPFIGPIHGVEGFMNCCGWGGEGIMHSPAGGALIADCILGTSICDIDVTEFAADRPSLRSIVKGEHHDR